MLEGKFIYWKVDEGELKQIKINENIYNIFAEKEPETTKEISEASKKQIGEVMTPAVKGKFKGKRVKISHSVPIYNIIVADLQKAHNKNEDLKETLSKYYPGFNDNSITRYLWAYKKHMGLPTKARGLPKYYSKDDRGRAIKTYMHNKVYENIANDVKEAIDNGRSIKRAIKKYYPEAKTSTIKSYVSMYKRFFRETDSGTVPHRNKYSKRYQKKAPEGSYAYSKTYQSYVKQDEVDLVLRALHKVGCDYKPTTDQIVAETRMKKNRVLATLSVLQEQGKVGYKIGYKDHPLTPVYHIKVYNEGTK
jgi:hypothetical protein